MLGARMADFKFCFEHNAMILVQIEEGEEIGGPERVVLLSRGGNWPKEVFEEVALSLKLKNPVNGNFVAPPLGVGVNTREAVLGCPVALGEGVNTREAVLGCVKPEVKAEYSVKAEGSKSSRFGSKINSSSEDSSLLRRGARRRARALARAWDGAPELPTSSCDPFESDSDCSQNSDAGSGVDFFSPSVAHFLEESGS